MPSINLHMSVPLFYFVISVFSYSLSSLPYPPTHCCVFKVTISFPVLGKGGVLGNARVLPLHKCSLYLFPTVLRSLWLWGLQGFSELPGTLGAYPDIWHSPSPGDRQPGCPQPSSTTIWGKRVFLRRWSWEILLLHGKNKTESPPNTAYKVNCSSMKDQNPKSETIGLMKESVGKYLSGSG